MATNIEVTISGINDIVSYLDRLQTRIEKPSEKLMNRLRADAIDETEAMAAALCKFIVKPQLYIRDNA